MHYHGNMRGMARIRSRITAQGQVSVPAEVRRKLGVGPGSVLEWEEQTGQIIVRRSGDYSSQDVHNAMFRGRPPTARTLDELKDGVRRHARKRFARH